MPSVLISVVPAILQYIHLKVFGAALFFNVIKITDRSEGVGGVVVCITKSVVNMNIQVGGG